MYVSAPLWGREQQENFNFKTQNQIGNKLKTANIPKRDIFKLSPNCFVCFRPPVGAETARKFLNFKAQNQIGNKLKTANIPKPGYF